MVNDSTARDIAPSSVAAQGNNAVKPKILRRPAQFSTGVSMMSLATPPARMTEIPLDFNPKPLPPIRPWQEDGKFAIALLTLLLAINLVVIVWLAAIEPKKIAKPADTSSESPMSSVWVHELGSGDTGSEQ